MKKTTKANYLCLFKQSLYMKILYFTQKYDVEKFFKHILHCILVFEFPYIWLWLFEVSSTIIFLRL